ncbi:Adenosine 5'-phosphosulfate reductase [Trichinella spiralis]|uniref:Adenosine 5'-phosphosulfate reductase n=1 Tax=Trichinella spiralis TaxID=6334 RepID=A0ABR3K8P2_TRISP
MDVHFGRLCATVQWQKALKWKSTDGHLGYFACIDSSPLLHSFTSIYLIYSLWLDCCVFLVVNSNQSKLADVGSAVQGERRGRRLGHTSLYLTRSAACFLLFVCWIEAFFYLEHHCES